MAFTPMIPPPAALPGTWTVAGWGVVGAEGPWRAHSRTAQAPAGLGPTSFFPGRVGWWPHLPQLLSGPRWPGRWCPRDVKPQERSAVCLRPMAKPTVQCPGLWERVPTPGQGPGLTLGPIRDLLDGCMWEWLTCTSRGSLLEGPGEFGGCLLVEGPCSAIHMPKPSVWDTGPRRSAPQALGTASRGE